LNKLLHNLVQNLNTLQKNLPTSQYELGIKCPHAEGLKKPIRFGVLLVATVKITVFVTLAVITFTD
jgi:hypothetical protein